MATCTRLTSALVPASFSAALDQVPRLVLRHFQFATGQDDEYRATTKERIKVEVAFACDGERLGIKWFVHEPTVRAVASETHGTVWEDSCVEFFCSTKDFQPGEYLNFEFSCIGTCLNHRGVKGVRQPQAENVVDDVWRESSLGTVPFDERPTPDQGLWTLAVAIPKKALGIATDVSIWDAGLAFNAYKCGDNLTAPHWVSLFEIDTAQPDFHRPDAFQPMHFA
eukprot:m.383388 g.383388  ORF g.383388 m.383388 type:complete len:224 (-) comp20046_c1_seq5:72-743(-)